MKHQNRFRASILIGMIVVGLVAGPIGFSLRVDRQRQLDTELLMDLRFGKVQEVRSLLKEGADPNARDLGLINSESPFARLVALIKRSHTSEFERAPTALSYALDEGWGTPNPARAELMKLLMDYRADVKLSEHCDRPPFLLALKWNDIETVRLFLDHGADANEEFEGIPALRWGIRTEEPQIVQMLLDHGARIHLQKDKNGLNDLDEARRSMLPASVALSAPYYHAENCAQIITILANATKMPSK